MADKITYYAIIDDFSSRAPSREAYSGAWRTGQRQVDEVFSRDLTWDVSPLLYSAEHGDTMFDFTEITEAEANEIVDRIRSEASRGE